MKYAVLLYSRAALDYCSRRAICSR